MQVKIFPTYSELSRATADLIKAFVAAKKDSLICIASGHTPVGVFKFLAEDIQSKKLDVSRCTFLSLDEWVGIDPSDPGSCLSMLKKDFFDHVPVRPEQIIFFNVLVADLQQECARINALIQSNGGLDVMLVGVGTNGHIGMNEPGTAFDSYAHIGELAEETKAVGQKYFTKNTSLHMGITLGLKHLQEAKLPIVMANGEKKANIIAKALQTNPTEQLPASIVHKIPHAMVMLDQQAANGLAISV
jgi:glucosamine-6-phosphate isomerase